MVVIEEIPEAQASEFAAVSPSARGPSSADVELNAPDGATEAPAGGLLAALSCRRRAPAGSAGDLPAGYRDLVAVARGLSPQERVAFEGMAWWSETETKDGARVFVLLPRSLDGDLEGSGVDMWKLLAFSVNKAHDHVYVQDKRFAVVWVQASDHRMWSLSVLRFKNSLPQRFCKNMEAVHVVHPSWGVRLFRLAAWPFASEEFWDRFYSHERIEFLDLNVRSVAGLGIPNDAYDFDKFLDTQAEMAVEGAGMPISSIPHSKWQSEDHG